jgi:hypothetical protein
MDTDIVLTPSQSQRPIHPTVYLPQAALEGAVALGVVVFCLAYAVFVKVMDRRSWKLRWRLGPAVLISLVITAVVYLCLPKISSADVIYRRFWHWPDHEVSVIERRIVREFSAISGTIEPVELTRKILTRHFPFLTEATGPDTYQFRVNERGGSVLEVEGLTGSIFEVELDELPRRASEGEERGGDGRRPDLCPPVYFPSSQEGAGGR